MPSDTALPARLLPAVQTIVREAGAMALRYFRRGEPTVARTWSKAGGSPVTEADVAVDTFLKIRLSELLPEAGWLSEETADDPRRLGRDLVWIVDPIDGTRAYMAGSPDWTVAVALLASDTPVLGIVHAAAHDMLYGAIAGAGATREGELIRVSALTDLSAASVAGPMPIVDRLARRHPGLTRLPRVPSLALRIARVAEGSIDVGLVTDGARDWDLAAADLVLREAGGRLIGLDGSEPAYNRPDTGHGELAAVPAALQRTLIDSIRAR